jgi:hypothetical protein
VYIDAGEFRHQIEQLIGYSFGTSANPVRAARRNETLCSHSTQWKFFNRTFQVFAWFVLDRQADREPVLAEASDDG